MAPSHYLNQCWNIVNWILANKPQWSLNRNIFIFIQENAFENVFWNKAAILSRPQCVKTFSYVWHVLHSQYHGITSMVMQRATTSAALWRTATGDAVLETFNWKSLYKKFRRPRDATCELGHLTSGVTLFPIVYSLSPVYYNFQSYDILPEFLEYSDLCQSA